MKRGFEHLNCAITSRTRRDETFLYFSLLRIQCFFFFSRNVTNFPAVLQPSSTCQWFRLLTVCCQCVTHQPIVFCVVRPTHIWWGLAMRAVSLFLLWLPPSFLASRGFAAQRSRACALPLLNLKKKRNCSQSTFAFNTRTNISQPHFSLSNVGHFTLQMSERKSKKN